MTTMTMASTSTITTENPSTSSSASSSSLRDLTGSRTQNGILTMMTSSEIPVKMTPLQSEKTTTSRVSPELSPFYPPLKPMYDSDLSSSSSLVTPGFSFLPSSATNDTTNDTLKGSSKTNNASTVLSSKPFGGIAHKSETGDAPFIKVSALDALAALASQQISPKMSSTNSTSTQEDTLIMPPPPPRQLFPKRNRSASNPEGMEKWDSYKNPSLPRRDYGRRWMVLPSTILEEELKSAHDLCREHEMHMKNMQGQPLRSFSRPAVVPVRKEKSTDFSIYKQPEVAELWKHRYLEDDGDFDDCDGDTAATGRETLLEDEIEVRSKAPALEKKKQGKNSKKHSKKQSKKKNIQDAKKEDARKDESLRTIAKKNLVDFEERVVKEELEDEPEEEPLDESELDPEELLRRARSRLLEDLSAENGLDKGVMAFPHSLDKYKEVYNKNGRIGIYTPAERAAIISKFNSKRTRRTWKKKIRYNCRKNLADRRMRVKGRFVKRSVEETAKDDATLTGTATPEGVTVSSSGSDSSRANSPLHSTSHSGPLAPVKEDEEDFDSDVDMPDVNDPDAGFQPTDALPYRRIRRHTIT